MNQDKRLWDYQWVRDLAMLACLGIVLWLAFVFRAILMPIAVALLLAYLCDPLLHYAEQKWKWRRSLTAFLIITFSSLLFIGLIVWLWPIVVKQIMSLGSKLPAYLQTTAAGFGIDLREFNFDPVELGRRLENPQELLGDIFSHSARAFDYVGRFLGVTGEIALDAILIPLYFFFFAWHFPHGVAVASQYIPLSKRERVRGIFFQMNVAVAGFFRGRLLVSAIMIVLYSLGWYFTEVPYSVLLGTLAGILNIIPYASGIFWPLAILVKYIDIVSGGGGDLTFLSVVVWPSLIFLGAQFIEGWILTPWIQSGQLDMSVPTVLIVVFIGGAVGGFLGLLLCIPVAACLKILYLELIHPPLVRWIVTH